MIPHQDRVFIGTSGWAYSTWKPGFYPDSVPQKKFLQHYASQLNSVEVNYTFRSLPTASMLAGWLAAAGPAFRFSFKAPQRITHILRLKDCSEPIAALARSLAPVASEGKMGIALFQLPPNFKADLPRLEAFLYDAAPHALRIAFEFRHASWFNDDVYDLLRRSRAALCVAESEDLVTPDIVTGPFACYRFRKDAYSPAQLDEIAATLLRRSAEGDVFAYFKHQDEPRGALCAVDILRRIQN